MGCLYLFWGFCFWEFKSISCCCWFIVKPILWAGRALLSDYAPGWNFSRHGRHSDFLLSGHAGNWSSNPPHSDANHFPNLCPPTSTPDGGRCLSWMPCMALPAKWIYFVATHTSLPYYFCLHKGGHALPEDGGLYHSHTATLWHYLPKTEITALKENLLTKVVDFTSWGFGVALPCSQWWKCSKDCLIFHVPLNDSWLDGGTRSCLQKTLVQVKSFGDLHLSEILYE